MCFVLGVLPSQLTEQYWQYSHEDLTVAMDLKVGQEMARLTQNYENLVKVASQLFGGEDKKNKPVELQNVEHAQQAFNEMFS